MLPHRAEHSIYPPELLKKRIGYLPKDKVRECIMRPADRYLVSVPPFLHLLPHPPTPQLQVVQLAGGHHLHMYNAAAVAAPVDQFLRTHTNPSHSRL